MSAVIYNFRGHWDSRLAGRRDSIARGLVTIEQYKGRVHVSCTPSTEFATGAMELLGRWRPRTEIWAFSAASGRLIIALCERVYGKEAIRLVGFPPEAS